MVSDCEYLTELTKNPLINFFELTENKRTCNMISFHSIGLFKSNITLLLDKHYSGMVELKSSTCPVTEAMLSVKIIKA